MGIPASIQAMIMKRPVLPFTFVYLKPKSEWSVKTEGMSGNEIHFFSQDGLHHFNFYADKIMNNLWIRTWDQSLLRCFWSNKTWNFLGGSQQRAPREPGRRRQSVRGQYSLFLNKTKQKHWLEKARRRTVLPMEPDKKRKERERGKLHMDTDFFRATRVSYSPARKMLLR